MRRLRVIADLNADKYRYLGLDTVADSTVPNVLIITVYKTELFLIRFSSSFLVIIANLIPKNPNII